MQTNVELTARAHELLSGWKRPNYSGRFSNVLFKHEEQGTPEHTGDVLKFAAHDCVNCPPYQYVEARYRPSMLGAYFTVYLHRIDEVCAEVLEYLSAEDRSLKWDKWKDVNRLYAFQYTLTALLELNEWTKSKKIESGLGDVLPVTFEKLFSHYCALTIQMQDRDPAGFGGLNLLPPMEFDVPDPAVISRFANALPHYLPDTMESDKIWHHFFWTLLENNRHLALRNQAGAHVLLSHMTHVAWDRSPVGARVVALEKGARPYGHRAPSGNRWGV